MMSEPEFIGHLYFYATHCQPWRALKKDAAALEQMGVYEDMAQALEDTLEKSPPESPGNRQRRILGRL